MAIVSHKFGFIFCKTRKTAGTSLEVYLGRRCGPEDIVTPILPPNPEHQPRNHRGKTFSMAKSIPSRMRGVSLEM